VSQQEAMSTSHEYHAYNHGQNSQNQWDGLSHVDSQMQTTWQVLDSRGERDRVIDERNDNLEYGDNVNTRLTLSRPHLLGVPVPPW